MSWFISREQREAATAVRDLVRRVDALLPLVVQALLTRGQSGGGTSEAIQAILGAIMPRPAAPPTVLPEPRAQ